jgi:glycosyltransferase involved in cell wall biosynthesis
MAPPNLKVLCLAFYAPPTVRPQSILIGKMIPEWIRQGVKPIIASYQTPEKWQIEVPIHYLAPRKIQGHILQRNIDQIKYYRSEASRLAALIKREGVDVIFSFANPQESNIIGALASRKSGCPFVSHFSDPWLDNHYSSFRGLNLLKIKFLEWLVIKQSQRIIFTNQAALDLVMKKYSTTDRKKALVIPHCFDPADYIKTPTPRGDKSEPVFIMRYIGVFYKERSPNELFKALTYLIKTFPDIARQIRLELIGADNEYAGYSRKAIQDLAKAHGLEEMIVIRSAVSYRESLRLMQTADCLIVIDANFENSPFLPSKVIDYAGAQEPIVGITPPNSPTAEVLNNLGFSSFSYGEEIKLADYLKNLVLRQIKPILNLTQLERFEVKNTTRDLVEVFNEIKSNLVENQQ